MKEEQKRRHGDLDAIMKGLESKSSVFRAQAICGAVNNRVFNDVINKHLRSLATDETKVMGYSISQLAIAALDKFGIEEYRGDDPTIIRLREIEKWFDG